LCWIWCANFMDCLMQRSGICFRMKFNGRKRYFRNDIVGLDGQGAIQHGCLYLVAPENSITDRDLLQREKVARVEINRAFQVLCRFFPAPLAPQNKTLQLEY